MSRLYPPINHAKLAVGQRGGCKEGEELRRWFTCSICPVIVRVLKQFQSEYSLSVGSSIDFYNWTLPAKDYFCDCYFFSEFVRRFPLETLANLCLESEPGAFIKKYSTSNALAPPQNTINCNWWQLHSCLQHVLSLCGLPEDIRITVKFHCGAHQLLLSGDNNKFKSNYCNNRRICKLAPLHEKKLSSAECPCNNVQQAAAATAAALQM